MGVLDLETTEENTTACRCHKHIHKSGGKVGSQLVSFWIHILPHPRGKTELAKFWCAAFRSAEAEWEPRAPLTSPLHKTHTRRVVQWDRFRRKGVTSSSLSWSLEAELPSQNVADAIPHQEAPSPVQGPHQPPPFSFVCSAQKQCVRSHGWRQPA